MVRQMMEDTYATEGIAEALLVTNGGGAECFNFIANIRDDVFQIINNDGEISRLLIRKSVCQITCLSD